MKDFDSDRQQREERERSFKICGKQFTYRPAIAPEGLLHYNRAITGEISPSEEEWIAIYDEAILALLEPGQEEEWRFVRNPDISNPLNVSDLNGLLQWLLEEQVGRPTGLSSDSSTGSGGNGTASKVVSSSPEEASKVSASDRSAT